MISAGRLWSLWEMLKRFETSHVLGALNYVSQTERKMRSDLEDLRRSPVGSTYSIEYSDQRKNLVGAMNNLRKAAYEYEIAGLSKAANEARDFLLSTEVNFAALDLEQSIRLHGMLYGTHSTALNVLDEMNLFVLTRGSAEYVTGDRVGFGEKVDAAFPSATYDSHEASKCLGLERWTACVMHCMRSLEPALKALEDTVSVAVPKEQWGDKINQIEAAIKAMNKGTHSRADVQWFADAATQFHFMKSAWRNYAHHLLHTYDEDRATEIYNATRTFMRHLSGKLAEQA